MTTAFVLPAGGACALPKPPPPRWGTAIHARTIPYRSSAEWLDDKSYLHDHHEQYLSIHHHRRHTSAGRVGVTNERTRSR